MTQKDLFGSKPSQGRFGVVFDLCPSRYGQDQEVDRSVFYRGEAHLSGDDSILIEKCIDRLLLFIQELNKIVEVFSFLVFPGIGGWFFERLSERT